MHRVSVSAFSWCCSHPFSNDRARDRADGLERRARHELSRGVHEQVGHDAALEVEDRPTSRASPSPASSGGAGGEDAHDRNVRFVVEPVQVKRIGRPPELDEDGPGTRHTSLNPNKTGAARPPCMQHRRCLRRWATRSSCARTVAWHRLRIRHRRCASPQERCLRPRRCGRREMVPGSC